MSIRGNQAHRRTQSVRLTLALPAIALAVWVYYPITSNYFFADDFLHLYSIVNDSLLGFLLEPTGGHMLVTRNAIFRLWYEVFGPDPRDFFWTVLLTHLLNVALLFCLIERLTDSVALACLGAAAWGSSQMHDGALGWYSASGHALVCTCMLAVLAGLARIGRGHRAARWAPIGWGALLLVASTSYGVGMGAAMVLPVAAWLLLPAAPDRARILLWLGGTAALIPPLYFGVLFLHTKLFAGDPLFLPTILAGLEWTREILYITLNLIGIGIVGLLSGMFYRPRLYPSSVGYALVAGYGAVLAAVLVRGPQPVRRRILACLLLAIGCYGSIGAGRGWSLTDSSPLQFIRMDRYQYAGMSMLAVAFCIGLARLGEWLRPRQAVSIGLLIAWLWITIALHARLPHPIVHFTWVRREAEMVVAAVRQRIAAAPPGADVYIDNQPFGSTDLVWLPRDRFPGWAGVFAIFFPENVVDGRRVFFVSQSVDAMRAARHGRRGATLFVGPSALPDEGGVSQDSPAGRAVGPAEAPARAGR